MRSVTEEKGRKLDSDGDSQTLSIKSQTGHLHLKIQEWGGGVGGVGSREQTGAESVLGGWELGSFPCRETKHCEQQKQQRKGSKLTQRKSG